MDNTEGIKVLQLLYVEAVQKNENPIAVKVFTVMKPDNPETTKDKGILSVVENVSFHSIIHIFINLNKSISGVKLTINFSNFLLNTITMIKNEISK